MKNWAFCLCRGLRDKEIKQLTVPEFNALVERYNTEQRFADLRAGVISAAMLNGMTMLAKAQGARFRGDATYSPYEFGLPFLQEPEEKKTQTEVEYFAFNRILAQTKKMGGKVTKRGR